MKLSLSHSFSYPASTVWEMFHDPASHVAKYESMGHTDLETLAEEVGDTSLDLTVRRTVEMEIPAVAKKFISPTNTVTSTDHWEDRGDGTYGGHFTVDIKGVPAQTRGETNLVATGDDSCEYTVSVDVKVKIPLVGEKIANALRPQLEGQLRDEFAAAEAWLAGS